MSSGEGIYGIVKAGGPALAKLVDDRFPTRRAFADAARLSRSDVSRFCSGKRTPAEHVIPQICAALGAPFPRLKVARNVIEKASQRMIHSLESALDLERERAAGLSDQLAHLKAENRDLRQKLVKIRQLAG